MAAAMLVQSIKSFRRVERRSAALLCVELRGLAEAASALDARLVLALASEFFSLVTQVVSARVGEAISAHHDAMLCAFSNGNPAQAAQQSVRAAQQIQHEFPVLADRWRQAHGVRSAVSQGVHLGETILGYAGLPGFEQRTAFGDAVTIAQAMLARARAGEFVMSESVMGALAVENPGLDAAPLPPLTLGRRQPIRIYGVLLDTRLNVT
jgi:class 3 adenylate cyclase